MAACRSEAAGRLRALGAVGCCRLPATLGHHRPSARPSPVPAVWDPTRGRSRNRGPARGEDPPWSGSARWGGGYTWGDLLVAGGWCVENIILEVLHGPPKCASGRAPPKKEPLVPRDVRLLKRPQEFFEQWSVGVSRKVALGSTLACLLSWVPWVKRAPCVSWPRGGGGMVAGGAHLNEDVPLVVEEVIPLVRLGLLQIRSRRGGSPTLPGRTGGGRGRRWRCLCGPADRHTPHQTP